MSTQTLHQLLSNIQLILYSNSPRRKQLLEEIKLPYILEIPEISAEQYPKDLQHEEIALYLSAQKSKSYPKPLSDHSILLTADTVVYCKGRILGKPKNKEEAITMLQLLSNSKHEVYTAITLKNKLKTVSVQEKTDVYFRTLTLEDITHYIDHYQPFDKAGAYGIQEWIGNAFVVRIDGSYTNVMGLPTSLLYEQLSDFITHIHQ